MNFGANLLQKLHICKFEKQILCFFILSKKKHPCNIHSRKLLKIGFEACFFLCNPTTSLSLSTCVGHRRRVSARH